MQVNLAVHDQHFLSVHCLFSFITLLSPSEHLQCKALLNQEDVYLVRDRLKHSDRP